MGRNGGPELGWAHGRGPGKPPDFGVLEGGPNALGEGGGGADSLTPQCSSLLYDSLLSSRIRVTPAAPPLRGPRTPVGRPPRAGPGVQLRPSLPL